MLPGIDVSHWQVEIDWSEVKRAGVKFAFIKATEFPDKRTDLFIDNLLYENLKGASENGIYWSAYHFFRTHIDPVIQAQAFVATVGEFTCLPPVLDLEVAGSKGEKLNIKVQQFLDEVERLTNRKPIIYTSGSFWRSYMMYEKRVHSDWARVYPLWMARYTSLWPTPIYPWAGWDFWQYSDSGKIPGVKTHVDLNWFNGSETELVERFVQNGTAYTPPEIPSMPDEEGATEKEYAGSEDKKSAFERAKNVNPQYRGDYQEAVQGPTKRYYASNRWRKPSRHSAGQQKRSVSHGLRSADERQWVRSYFVEKALKNMDKKPPRGK